MRFIRPVQFGVAPLLLRACGAALAIPYPASAQAQADQAMAFDIPAQPLDTALALYFRTTGVQLLYDSSLATGIRSSPVKGSYSPREALHLMLRGTGLVVRYSRASAAIITRPTATVDSPFVPLGRVVVRERIITRISPIDRLAYYQQLEAELQARLRDSRQAGRLKFDIVMELTVEQDGSLRDIAVRRGSGDRRIDRILIDVLAGAKVTPPPAGLAQPLAVALRGERK